MALLRALIICAQHLSDWISHFTNKTRQFCRTERAAHDQTGHTYGAKTIWPEAVRVRGLFLESPETFLAHFGWHNSLCIFKTKASRGTKLCSYFNFYTLCNIWKDQLYRISRSTFHELLLGSGKFSGLSRNWPQFRRIDAFPLPDSVADQAGQFWKINRLILGVNKTKTVLLMSFFFLLFFSRVLCRSPISLSSPRALRKVALALYFVSVHLLAFMYIFQVVF